MIRTGSGRRLCWRHVCIRVSERRLREVIRLLIGKRISGRVRACHWRLEGAGRRERLREPVRVSGRRRKHRREVQLLRLRLLRLSRLGCGGRRGAADVIREGRMCVGLLRGWLGGALNNGVVERNGAEVVHHRVRAVVLVLGPAQRIARVCLSWRRGPSCSYTRGRVGGWHSDRRVEVHSEQIGVGAAGRLSRVYSG